MTRLAGTPAASVVGRHAGKIAGRDRVRFLKRTAYGNTYVASQVDEGDTVLAEFAPYTSYSAAMRVIREALTQ